jgi:DNA-binding HxlR family transcriptional regulator
MPQVMTTPGLEQYVKRYGALANKHRIVIVKFVRMKRKASWTEIEHALEQQFKGRINPNSLSFHLNKLIESGFLERTDSSYVLGQEGLRRIKEIDNLSF